MVLNFMVSPALTATEAIARDLSMTAKRVRPSRDLEVPRLRRLAPLARAGDDAAAIVTAGRQEFKRDAGNPRRSCRGCGIRVFSGVDRDTAAPCG